MARRSSVPQAQPHAESQAASQTDPPVGPKTKRKSGNRLPVVGAEADVEPGDLGVSTAPQAAAGCGSLSDLEALIPTCGACPRLRRYCGAVAESRIKRYADWTYHGRPVAGFGDPAARVLVVGLAPAAHGANRTGRLFTGDRSGDFLFAALHRLGLASQPQSDRRDDGLTLSGVYISVAGRCAPPTNRPTPVELDRCRAFLQRELNLLSQLRAIVALGGLAHDAVLQALGAPRARFAHGAVHALPAGQSLLDSYHVSQQNTFTGRLTPAMLDAVLSHAAAIAGLAPRRQPPVPR